MQEKAKCNITFTVIMFHEGVTLRLPLIWPSICWCWAWHGAWERLSHAKILLKVSDYGGAFAVAAEEQNILHLNSLGLDFSFKPALIKFLATWSRLICKHIANCCLFKHRAHTLDICIHQNYLMSGPTPEKSIRFCSNYVCYDSNFKDYLSQNSKYTVHMKKRCFNACSCGIQRRITHINYSVPCTHR